MEINPIKEPYMSNNGRHADSLERDAFIIGPDDPILITGATGFIGSRLVETLLDRGFRNLRCFARPSSEVARLEALASRHGKGAKLAVVKGNLLSCEDCAAATKDVAVIFHLATGREGKSFPDAFMNSVVTTRNLLEASVLHKCSEAVCQRKFVRGLYQHTKTSAEGVG